MAGTSAATPISPRLRTFRYTVAVVAQTKLKMTALTGSYADLRVGRRIEVKYEDPERKQVADWIKVELSEPGVTPDTTRKP